MTVPLAGRTVLVTGAARGIGEHVARLAAAKGARVSLVGLEPDRLAALMQSLPGGSARHCWHEADVRDQAALDDAVRNTLEQTGQLDIVMANAGVAPLGTVAVSDVEALVATIDVNLNGVIRTVKAALPAVRAARGHILIVSSAAAFTALPGMAAYCASKAGVEQFGTVLRMENAHLGVSVGTAHPIWIDTDMVRNMQSDLPSFQAALSRIPGPLGTVVTVQRCAEMLVRGMERRRRRVYIPRTIGGIQAMRSLFTSGFAESVIRRAGGNQVEQMEKEAQAVGRSFGEHNPGGVRPEPAARPIAGERET
jgi:NAD(P)-dependent dehydrogenase (short-subunit alcohol dehydrogenase family)